MTDTTQRLKANFRPHIISAVGKDCSWASDSVGKSYLEGRSPLTRLVFHEKGVWAMLRRRKKGERLSVLTGLLADKQASLNRLGRLGLSSQTSLEWRINSIHWKIWIPVIRRGSEGSVPGRICPGVGGPIVNYTA